MEKNVVFTKHALKRARERHLWKYVNKEKFFYDAKDAGINRAMLNECIYCYCNNKGKTYILTMMRV